MLAQWLRRNAHKRSANTLRIVANLWRPFRGAGIKIVDVADDYREIKVQMKLRWYNKNYVGTQFGGSMYAMTDPFYMMMLINNLGSEYIVWDKGAQIDFIKPGRSTVHAHFIFTESEIADIKQQANTNKKYVFQKPVDIIDDEGTLIASVIKTLYVRKKTPLRDNAN